MFGQFEDDIGAPGQGEDVGSPEQCCRAEIDGQKLAMVQAAPGAFQGQSGADQFGADMRPAAPAAAKRRSGRSSVEPSGPRDNASKPRS